MSDSTTRNIKMGAQLMLAGGFMLSAIAIFREHSANTLKGLGESRLNPLPKTKLPAGGAAVTKKTIGRPKLKQYDISDIDDRVGLIGELIRKGSLNPELRETTVRLVSEKCDSFGNPSPNGDRWCVKEKDCLAEVKAVFNAVRNPKSKYAVRYVRDAMLADVFTSADRTLFKSHGGDCDDYVITLGSMLMSIGHPVRLRVVATRRTDMPDDKAPWSHIYLLTPTTFDNPNAKWIAAWLSVDGSMDKPLGWEAPGAAEVAKSGKPAGIIARVRDYTLMKPEEAA
jgi:hypothetical protein